MRGRAEGTPTIWLPKSRLVRLRCLYFTKSEPVFKTYKKGRIFAKLLSGERIRKNSAKVFRQGF